MILSDGDESVAGTYKPPFPWFGGKSRVAHLVWQRFGGVRNYVEPFFGSGAVLFLRPEVDGTETVNDRDGFVANFWRAVQQDPNAVAEHADNPANECDLHARHAWLTERRELLRSRLEGDPDYFDVKIAGWWVWGICCWIGGEFCSGSGPWQSVEVAPGDRQLIKLEGGRGVKRQLIHLGDAGQGVKAPTRRARLIDYMRSLAERLRDVRVCCGDWARVVTTSPTTHLGLTGVFLDPPYSAKANREKALYAEESLSVAHDVREWALANGDNPLLRIALCGYEGEHQVPDAWECVPWKAGGGYGSYSKNKGRENAHRERIWFSPHCLKPAALTRGDKPVERMLFDY